MSKRMLLIGSGPAHLEVLRSMAEGSWQGVDVCLISPSSYYEHKGMLSGYIEGIYSAEDIRVNAESLLARAGGQFIKKIPSVVYPRQKKLVCSDDTVYPFDVISFDMGESSLLKPSEGTGIERTADPLYKQIDKLKQTNHPLIIGGGTSGIEVAFAMQSYKNNRNIPGDVRLLTSDKTWNTSSPLSNRLRSLLTKRGVRVWENETADIIEDSFILTNLGNKVRNTGVLWLGGASKAGIFDASGIAADEEGRVLVQPTMQLKNFDYIFAAAGHVTGIDEFSHAKKKGSPRKQETVLAENLKRFLTDEPLEIYRPEKPNVSIISTGNQKGLRNYGPVSIHNHRHWKIKNKQDQEFIHSYT
ncbi:FAD-dependent oxidoreductase [Halobacillus salinarum]|uniref:FAD-dependent oxidoreductase n=1 Tax=Halobacillus salinarum TaxID=2932257 RepID=A0ABY4EIU0_9BACI|nr:FAD-dependent oxidoreductase [Halobacillus salinarum]UOQ44377.1 FAD-dependent oxidoreductase [Halobacillus salinarum]